MTDPAIQDSDSVPDPTVVHPGVRNGQCAPEGFSNNHHLQAKTPETLSTGQEMKITDSVEGEGNSSRMHHVFSDSFFFF